MVMTILGHVHNLKWAHIHPLSSIRSVPHVAIDPVLTSLLNPTKSWEDSPIKLDFFRFRLLIARLWALLLVIFPVSMRTLGNKNWFIQVIVETVNFVGNCDDAIKASVEQLVYNVNPAQTLTWIPFRFWLPPPRQKPRLSSRRSDLCATSVTAITMLTPTVVMIDDHLKSWI